MAPATAALDHYLHMFTHRSRGLFVAEHNPLKDAKMERTWL